MLVPHLEFNSGQACMRFTVYKVAWRRLCSSGRGRMYSSVAGPGLGRCM